jgi:tRNA threonylcarbamoyladenosine biosynthesis protein TsaE
VSEPSVTVTMQLGSIDETIAFAEALGQELEPGDLVLLEGDLGAGKTTFVSGLARGMGLASAVKSPTYTLVHEYRGIGRPGLGHVDLYRLPEGKDLSDLGLDDLLARGPVAVEWGTRLFVPGADALLVRMSGPDADRGPEWRELTLEGRGERGDHLASFGMAWLMLNPPPDA